MNSATAAHADSGGILDILLSYWWLAALSWWFSAFFGGSILEWITESFGVGLAALRRSVSAGVADRSSFRGRRRGRCSRTGPVPPSQGAPGAQRRRGRGGVAMPEL